ncbi:MAG: hypothetical protein JO345_14865 [Streptosporangiaceae bacterium]|nr:hypothetical protein [Streptosporangiaceae bacterium]
MELGAELKLTRVTWRSSEATVPNSPGPAAAAGVTLHVPPGQSVALYSEPAGDATELLSIVAGLRRPSSGQVMVDEVAVEQLSGPALDDYLASRGLLNARFPLVPRLPAEQQWRTLIARALRLSPRLVLAEDCAPGLDSRSATAVLDLLMDVHAQFGFTLLLTVSRLAMASHCQRLVRLAGAAVIEDELINDDPWTRDRVDRIG